MSWNTITVEVPNELKDAIVGEFSQDGILGVWEKPMPEADQIELILYFDEARMPPLVGARVGRLFERNGYAPQDAILGKEQQQDWTKEWRKGYTSFAVGTRFQVVPSWETADDVGSRRIVLGIDPGLAFGTGTHETTQLMLTLLEEIELSEGPVLDLGTGSGILTIAAEKLGFKVEAGCDLDQDATQVARENLRRNGIRARLFVGSADSLRSGSVRLVLANLTSDVLHNLLGEIRRVLPPGGLALLSGILDSQVVALGARLEVEGFEIESETGQGEWVAMKVRRHGD